MKTASRNKFLHCFRPIVDTEPPNRSADLGFAYVTVETKEHINRSSSSKSMFFERGCSLNSENSEILQPPKRSFSRVFKAVIFEAFVTKRVRGRKGYRQLSCRSNCKVSRDLVRSFNLGSEKMVNLESVDIKNQMNHTNFALTHTSSSTKITSESKAYSENLSDSMKQSIEKQRDSSPEEADMGCKLRFNFGLFLFLICLVMTVFWGKLLGILFTSIWLYFVRHWREDNVRQKEVTERPKSESKGYKKKVIMEGLLERKHHRSIKI